MQLLLKYTIILNISLFTFLGNHSYADKFASLEGEDKVAYGYKKFCDHWGKAYQEATKAYNKLRQNDISEEAYVSIENTAYAPALKWGAKLLFAAATTMKIEEIPEEFVRFVSEQLLKRREYYAFDPEIKSLQTKMKEFEISFGETYNQYSSILGSERVAQMLSNNFQHFSELKRELEKKEDTFKSSYPIKLQALQDLWGGIEERRESSKESDKKIWDVGFLYQTIEDLVPGFISSHLPHDKHTKKGVES